MIASQFSPILRKTSNLLRLLFWISPLILSSYSSLPSLPRLNESLTQLCSTRHSPVLEYICNPTFIIQEVAPVSTGLHFSISLPENDHSVSPQEMPPFNSLLSDVRPLLPRLNHLKCQPDHSTLGRQHR